MIRLGNDQPGFCCFHEYKLINVTFAGNQDRRGQGCAVFRWNRYGNEPFVSLCICALRSDAIANNIEIIRYWSDRQGATSNVEHASRSVKDATKLVYISLVNSIT